MDQDAMDQKQLLRNLMDSMPDMIYFKDRQSRFIMMNKAAATWQGYASPEEAIGKTDFDDYTEEDARRMFADEQRIMATGEPLRGIEEHETWKSGQTAWVSTTKMPLRDADGNIVGTFGVSRDITEHKEAELRAASLANEVRRIKEEMEKDVRMAGELQKTFFPRTYPVFPSGVPPSESAVQFHHHYRASEMVCGDVCSIRRLSRTKCGVLQCDVMGHGVRAALGTALITAMVQEFSRQNTDPGAFLGHMNELLSPILHHGGMFLYATACYAVFDASSGILRVANAGHPIPMHFRASANTVDWLADDETLRGPALVINESRQYATVEKQIDPGDSVVMYTDGLYEVDGPANEDFGRARLLEAARGHVGLSLPRLFPALMDDVCRFAGKDEFGDDVCLTGFTFHKPARA